MRWLGLVRNVMLGREGMHREVLLGIVERAGGADVRNHLTTGNVSFTAPVAQAPSIAARAADDIAAVLGRHEPVVLRPWSWLTEAMDEDPFSRHRDDDAELVVGLLPIDAPAIDPARVPDPHPSIIVRLSERELFVVRPRGGGRRPDPVSLLEKATGARATGRAWSTLATIARTGAGG